MDPITIAAIIGLAKDLGLPLLTLLLHKDAAGVPAVSVVIILQDTDSRNAATVALIAAANSQPVKTS